MTLTLRLSTLSILLFAGCGPTVEPPRPTDAGLTADSGSGARDTGSNSSDTGSTDTGSVQDAGNASADVMPAADAGLGEDAGTALDAGPQGPIPCGGPIEEACPNDMICVKNDGLCQGRPNGQFPTGTCQPVLAQCPAAAEADAVCGCGGATYASRCHAQLAGEDVAGPGVCQDQVGYNRCSGAPDCGRGEFYCATPVGHCDAVSFCLPNPNMCTQEESPDRGSPVCDCNGNEHHNLCNARLAGQSIRNTGPCR